MSTESTAAILSVGTELTEGSTQDSHGQYISALLHGFGVRTSSIVLIPDDAPLFERELARLSEANDLVVITGGLGPTSDDLTRETVASVAGVSLEFHEELWNAIERRFAGRTLSETNRKQALIPAGFEVVQNPYGTAAGFWGRVGVRSDRPNGALLAAIPGPPRELRPIFEDSVLPVIGRELGLAAPEELRASVYLLSESLLEQFLVECRRGGVRWGTRAEAYRIVLILRGGSGEEREAMLAALATKIGWLRIRRSEVGAEELVVDALKETRKVMVAAESCTGGLVGKLITDVSGASEVFWGSAVVYSNQAKTTVVGVPTETIERFGAVSSETVEAMAQGALGLSGADVSCAITGVAGPTGGSPDKPVGTVWIGTADRAGRNAKRLFHFSGNRDMVRRKSAVAALLMCEATIRGKEVDNIDMWQYI